MTRQIPINRELFDLYNARENVIDRARNFFDKHADEDGNLSADDQREFDKQMAEFKDLTKKIDYVGSQDLPGNDAIKKFLSPKDGRITNGKMVMDNTNNNFAATDDYKQHFYDAVRGNFKNDSADFLRVGVDSQGGYLLPVELDAQIATKLEEENSMRKISRVIQTNSRHQIPIMASQPNAQWLSEGQEINLQSGNFEQVTLGAYKLCAGVKISNELLQDSYYNLQEFFTEEFAKSFAAEEEETFVSGNGTTEPQGFLTALTAATDTASATTTAGASLVIDDLINTVYSLQRAYRTGAVWLMHDSTIQAIRKIKDSNLQMYWTASTTEGEPPQLFGYPVYSSSFMPQYASGAVIAAFGNFSKGYTIADRSQRTFKALYEILALNDLAAFIAIERIDARLVDKRAIKVLKLK